MLTDVDYLAKYYEELLKGLRLYALVGCIMLFAIMVILFFIAFKDIGKGD